MKTLEEIATLLNAEVITVKNEESEENEVVTFISEDVSFCDIQDLAYSNGCKIIGIRKRNGCPNWYEHEYFIPIDNEQYYAEKYTIFHKDDADNLFDEEVKPSLVEANSLEEAEDLLDYGKNLLSKIEEMDDNEFLFLDGMGNIDTMKKVSYSDSYGSYETQLAIIKDSDENE